MRDQKLYAVDFDTIKGRKVEIFEDLEEATIFFDRVATINKDWVVFLLEVAKIQIHNETYFVEQKALKMK